MTLKFGPHVTNLVWAVTGVGKNRKERNECAYGRMEQLPEALILKLADRIANAEACAKTRDHRLEMYQREYPGFKARLERLGSTIDAKPVAELMWARLDQTLAI
jgi:(p)ppGpp synthase/HD superfamily hydrolase